MTRPRYLDQNAMPNDNQSLQCLSDIMALSGNSKDVMITLDRIIDFSVIKSKSYQIYVAKNVKISLLLPNAVSQYANRTVFCNRGGLSL